MDMANFLYERFSYFYFLCELLDHANFMCDKLYVILTDTASLGLVRNLTDYGYGLIRGGDAGWCTSSNRWLIPSNSGSGDKINVGVASERVPIEHESYVVKGLLSKDKEVNAIQEQSRKCRVIELVSEEWFQVSMDVDEANPKKLQVTVLFGEHHK
ncbi:unnamed protein product [Cuscuta epithymum]|uniref:Uncharacterized protein n=1 Tax=Cuscuta epithymum TaxID=186058 RepID=A0AAV0EY70_9ASTE|nr:unnamed protein product [Cuscuta epithymum]